MTEKKYLPNSIRKKLHCSYFSYDTILYPFKNILEELFGCKIEELHKHLGYFEEFERSTDQSTLAHKVFYSNYKNVLEPTYIKFIKNIIGPIINKPFYFQKIPTFRIGIPGNKFVGEFHKDSNYNHQSYEVNFNLGIAGYIGDAALKVQSNQNSKEFKILECPYGSIFSFDHIDCLHGSEINNSDISMVSFDFRLAIKDLYFESDSKSVNLSTEFKPGGYFSDLPI